MDTPLQALDTRKIKWPAGQSFGSGFLTAARTSCGCCAGRNGMKRNSKIDRPLLHSEYTLVPTVNETVNSYRIDGRPAAG